MFLQILTVLFGCVSAAYFIKSSNRYSLGDVRAFWPTMWSAVATILMVCVFALLKTGS